MRQTVGGFAALGLGLATLIGCGAPPAIDSFSATPAVVEIGDPVTLSWRVIDAESVNLAPVGPVPPSSTYTTVNPTQTTSYVLSATNGAGTTTSDPVTVTVNPRLDVAGGTYKTATTTGLSLAAVLRELSAAPPTAAVTVTVTPPSGPAITLNCPANQGLCLFSDPARAPVAGTWVATATIAGVAVTDQFTVDPADRIFNGGPVFAQQLSSTSVKVSWGPAAGAVSYRVWLVDRISGAAVGPAQVVTSTQATLTATSPIDGNTGVAIETAAVDLDGVLATLPLAAPNVSYDVTPLGGNPDAWKLYLPSAFSGNTLTVPVNLSATERLAAIVLNVDGADYAPADPPNVQLGITGTLSLPQRVRTGDGEDGWSPPRFDAALDSRALHAQFLEEDARRVAEALASGLERPTLAVRPPGPPAPAPATASFCVINGNVGGYVRRSGTLKAESTHAIFYVDDADLADYDATPDIWTRLSTAWEGATPGTGIYAKDTQTFGPESDVDANGKLIVFFSNKLGAPVNNAVRLGYFSAGDTLFTKDTTTNCTGTNGNGADMFLMNGIANIVASGKTASQTIDAVYPDTLAHEFQHLINVNAHCIVNTCSLLEEVWLNEALSMVAEDITGFGWNNASARSEGGLYLDRLNGQYGASIYSHDKRSLTAWEGDPIGNYEGAHAYLRYWTDRFGQPVLMDLVQGDLRGLERVETVFGMPFARQLAEWTTALMFSDEPFNPSPLFNYQGAAWTPLHSSVGYVNYLPLNPGGASGLVRRDGWNAFVTGTGTGAAQLTVTTSDTVKPHVVVVKFSGFLPQCSSLPTTTTGGTCP